MTKTNPFSSLVALYEKMDAAWNATASRYEFTCNGCHDNCCATLFFHHTHMERAYLRHGFKTLGPALKKEIRKNAKLFIQAMAEAKNNTEAIRIMCPVNKNGRCTLYPYRPMICRLHGIPHQLKKPGHPMVKAPGCHAGEALFKAADHPFDRTPFYKEMSLAEMQFCRTHGKTSRIRQTIAQMLV